MPEIHNAQVQVNENITGAVYTSMLHLERVSIKVKFFVTASDAKRVLDQYPQATVSFEYETPGFRMVEIEIRDKETIDAYLQWRYSLIESLNLDIPSQISV